MPPFNKTSTKTTTARKSDVPVLITGTLAIINDLIAVLTTEMDLVKMRKTKEHAVLLKQKQRLAMDYRANMKSISAQPDILKQAPEDVRVAVRDAAQKLATVTDANAKMLRTAIVATQRLIQNIIAIVKKEVLLKPGYKNPKTAHLALGTYSPTCQPVTGSRTV